MTAPTKLSGTNRAWMNLLPVHASYSQLGSWNECQQRYVIEKAFHPAAVPSWYFIGGSSFHEATESWDLGQTDDLIGEYYSRLNVLIAEADAEEPDRSLWRAGGRRSKTYPDKETEQFWLDVGPEWCQLYQDHFTHNDEPIWESVEGIRGIELPFDVELGGVRVKGAIDRVRVIQGELFLEDIKTGSGQPNVLQLGLYKVAFEQAFGETPSFGRFWNPRKSGAGIPVNLDRYDKPMFDRLYAAFETQRRSGVIVPNLGPNCDRCDVRRYCSAYGGDLAIDLEA